MSEAHAIPLMLSAQPIASSIEISPGQVRFWAHLRSAGPRTYLVHEWEYGGYDRTIEVPDGYGAGADATLTNGQLAIRVLRGEPAGPLTLKPKDAGR